MRRTPLILLLPLAVASGAGATRHSSSVACPGAALPLTTNSIAPASRVALARETPKSRPQVTGADFASTDRQRGGTAKTQCGKRAWQRTVVVYIDLRAYQPSASLSQRVSFVSRFGGGYRVWEIVH